MCGYGWIQTFEQKDLGTKSLVTANGCTCEHIIVYTEAHFELTYPIRG